MCATYTIRRMKDVAAAFGIPADDLKQEYYPGFLVPAIRADGLAFLTWGLVPFWSKSAKLEYSTFNARAETVAKAPTFREPFKKRRCLIPSDGFFEWSASKPKTRYRFEVEGGGPIAFAGIWDAWDFGERIETASMLTTSANATVEPIHGRMPVILRPADYALWLDESASPTELMALLAPFDGPMTAEPAPKR